MTDEKTTTTVEESPDKRTTQVETEPAPPQPDKETTTETTRTVEREK